MLIMQKIRSVLAASIALALWGCGSSGSSDNTSHRPLNHPAAPAGQGAAETVPLPAVPAFADNAATNQRGDARYATLDTNAGVRVLATYLNVWKPLTQIVDAGVTAPANGVSGRCRISMDGVPNDGTPDGTIANSTAHAANIDYVVKATAARTPGRRYRRIWMIAVVGLQRDRRPGAADRRMAHRCAASHQYYQCGSGCEHRAVQRQRQ
jgi:hypothetical protein